MVQYRGNEVRQYLLTVHPFYVVCICGMFPECCARVIRLMKMLMKSHEIILRSTIILSPFVKTFQHKHTVQLCDPPLYHTTFLNLIHSYKFFHSAQRRKPERVSSSVFFLPVNEDL